MIHKIRYQLYTVSSGFGSFLPRILSPCHLNHLGKWRSQRRSSVVQHDFSLLWQFKVSSLILDWISWNLGWCSIRVHPQTIFTFLFYIVWLTRARESCILPIPYYFACHCGLVIRLIWGGSIISRFHFLLSPVTWQYVCYFILWVIWQTPRHQGFIILCPLPYSFSQKML